jgi:hypothetical protein
VRRLPLDDPRWLPLADALARACPRTGDHDLAARVLTEAMAKPGGVRSMRWRVRKGTGGPEREQLPLAFWAEQHELYWSGAEKRLMIIERRRAGQIVTADAARGYAFFVWKPDLDKLYPDAAVTAAAEGPRRSRTQERIREAVEKELPGEWEHLEIGEIMKRLGIQASRDTYLRALGRRKD